MRKETNIDELKTMTEAPETLHLDIGLNNELHTYQLVKPKKKRGRPPTLDAMNAGSGTKPKQSLGAKIGEQAKKIF